MKGSENIEEFKDDKNTINILMHFLLVFIHSDFLFKHIWNHSSDDTKSQYFFSFLFP